jgi:putative effector of murein hydrolase
MNTQITDVWVYLSATPLLGLTATLLAYQAAYWLYRKSGFNPLLNPVAIAVALLVAVLHATHTPYKTYFDGAQFVHFLLGPTTIALAVPLYAQLVVAITSAAGVGWLGGASRATLLSLAPKSVTTPIAMGIAEKIGGFPSLTEAMVVSTGIIGAVAAKYVLNALRITDHGVRGFSVGVAARGIGTARAFQVSEEAGAFSSGLAMGLNGLVTALLFAVLMLVIA